jgi:hypothetical protein
VHTRPPRSQAWHVVPLALSRLTIPPHHVKIYPIGVKPSLARRRYRDLSPTHQANASWCLFQVFLTTRWQILKIKAWNVICTIFVGPRKGSMQIELSWVELPYIKGYIWGHRGNPPCQCLSAASRGRWESNPVNTFVGGAVMPGTAAPQCYDILVKDGSAIHASIPTSLLYVKSRLHD